MVVTGAEVGLELDWGEEEATAAVGGAEVITGRGVEGSRLEDEPTAAYIDVNASVGVGAAAAGLALGLPHSLYAGYGHQFTEDVLGLLGTCRGDSTVEVVSVAWVRPTSRLADSTHNEPRIRMAMSEEAQGWCRAVGRQPRRGTRRRTQTNRR